MGCRHGVFAWWKISVAWASLRCRSISAQKRRAAMVADGKLGRILKIVAEYPQGYAITALTGEEKAIANWRANPEIAGISNCMGDTGCIETGEGWKYKGH